MALHEFDPKGARRAFKRRHKAERRDRRMQKAIRFNLYARPLAALLTALAALAAVAGRMFR